MIEHLADDAGVLLRRDAVLAFGDDKVLSRSMRRGTIVRLRHGAYALATVWAEADRVARHRLLVRAVQRQYGDDVALSHASAHLEMGGPDWRLDLSDGHVTHLVGHSGRRRSSRLIHHHGTCLVDDVTRGESGWLTSPTRTALDTASLLARDPAVAVLDWHLHQGLTTRPELAQMFQRMQHWPHTLRLQIALRMAEPRSESVAETRARLLFLDQGLPVPVPQYEVTHPSGRLIGRLDFAWPEHGLMCEVDGAGKYLRQRLPGETVEETVLREKRREDQLREVTGWSMVRLVWSDLDRPQATAERVRRALRLAA